ncbi:MAG: methyl-accepting chemotaxis protein [Oscillospiraceae bacterium]|nr:methyl-accepting chemotaxis protein [Oscillospiraceae bacterium]
MRKMFSFNTISWKIALIVFSAVLAVAGSISVYMESRILSSADRYSRAELQNQIHSAVQEYNLTFTDAIYTVQSMRNFAETFFDVDEYQKDAEYYFDNTVSPIMSDFVCSVLETSGFISGAYFAVHPDLAGYPLVREVYFEETEDGVEASDPQTYEEYMQTDSEDTEWFYGAYDSGGPYWTHIYEWADGEIMVSYVEPVIKNGIKAGIVGVDVPIGKIENLIADFRVYDTGFALFEDRYNDFFLTNEFIQLLDAEGKEKLTYNARLEPEGIFEMELNGRNFIVVHNSLINDYSVYILVPENEYKAESAAALFTFCVVFAIVLMIVLVVSVSIGRTFSKPLIALADFMERAGSTGDIALRAEDIEALNDHARRKDEIGVCITSMLNFEALVTGIESSLESLADGDYSRIVPERSDSDIMGKACNRMINSMLSALWKVTRSAADVSTDSGRIADIAQALSENSAEQTAAVNALSGTIENITEYTKDNAEMADRAAALAGTIKHNAEKGSRQMDEMMSAVRDIDQASHGINKVMKVIDDIAFQTNILALNAAVEAARAGQHGKGFAVVAEEVRTLAAKSAAAAKDTGALIADTIHKAELGSQIANFTAASLEEIVSGINESSKIVEDIAASSDKQLDGIGQITLGIDRVSQIVSQNSSTAGESADASALMREQSKNLEELIKHFKLRDRRTKTIGPLTGVGERRAALPSAGESLPAPKNSGRALTAPDADEHSKY